MKRKEIQIDNSPYAVPGRVPVVVARIRQYCESLPDGEAITIRPLSAAVRRLSLREFITHPAIEHVSTLIVHEGRLRRVFGNPRTIEALRNGNQEKGQD